MQLGQRYAAQHGTTVKGGPFAGLVYPLDRVPEIDVLVAKFVGSYEEELHPVIAEAIQRAPAAFVNFGCADGYYAVGFAKASPTTTVFAFDVAHSARRVCRELAEMNDVATRVQLGGRASPRSLTQVPLNDCVLLSDVEGAEADIFTMSLIRRLGSAPVVIELHEWKRSGCEATLRDRFSDTHTCEIVSARVRNPDGYPLPKEWLPQERALAISEWRKPHSKWAIFRPS